MAHPDDAEFMCTGTMALLHARGWEIHIATMTPGDCGSNDLGPEEISAIRREEARRAAAVLEGSYHCLEERDGFLRLDPPTKCKAVALIRRVRPRVVFTLSPMDYLIDHEATSTIVRDATFWSGVPNLKTDGVEPFRPVPYLYYTDAMEGKDLFGQPIRPMIAVDISGVIDTKVEMLRCHASQREWLLKQHGMDEYLHAMQAMGESRGKLVGVAMAEGFRQHLGHGYPQDDLLARELGPLVHSL